MAIKPRAYQGQILIYRDGLPYRDYGDTRVTTDDYGTGFLAACAALADDDILVLGPGVYTTVNATIAAARVHVIANGTVIKRKTATNYTHLVKVTGNDCIIDGLKVNGGGASNTGSGFGFWVTGDRCRLKNVQAISTRGTTVDNGDGSTIKIDDCTDTVLDGFYSYDAEYAGLWLNKTPRCFISNVSVVDAGNRSLSLNSSVALDLITVTNFNAVANTAGCKSRWNTNIDTAITLRELQMTNVTLVDTDMISAGVSYQDESSQMIKFQNIERVLWDRVTLTHGSATGSGSPAARTVYIQTEEGPGEPNTPPDLWVMKNCSLSSAISCELKLPKLICENTHFGVRDENDYNELFYRLRCEYAEFKDCVLDSGSKTQIFEMGSDTADTDRYVFKRCQFKSNSASSTYVMNHSDDEDLTTLAGCFVCDESNTFDNVGAGTMYRSDNVHGNLILTTDANGDMLFDDTLMSTQKIVSFYTSATSGNFTVTYSGQVTSSLAYNVSASNLKVALEALSNVDLVTVTGSGTAGSPWVVTFQGKLDGINTAPTLQDVDLAGGTLSGVTNVQSAVSLGKHPHPGDGPAYFPGLDVPANGKRIWNVNWSPDATQIVTERGWIAHNGEWKEIT